MLFAGVIVVYVPLQAAIPDWLILVFWLPLTGRYWPWDDTTLLACTVLHKWPCLVIRVFLFSFFLVYLRAFLIQYLMIFSKRRSECSFEIHEKVSHFQQQHLCCGHTQIFYRCIHNFTIGPAIFVLRKRIFTCYLRQPRAQNDAAVMNVLCQSDLLIISSKLNL